MASLTDHDGYRGESDVSVIKSVWKVGPLEGAQELCKKVDATRRLRTVNPPKQEPIDTIDNTLWPSISSSSSLIFCVYYTPRKPALAWYSADGSSADTLQDFGKRLRSLLVFKHRIVTRFWRFTDPKIDAYLQQKRPDNATIYGEGGTHPY